MTKEKDRSLGFGEIVADFVNAESMNEGFFALLDRIPEVLVLHDAEKKVMQAIDHLGYSSHFVAPCDFKTVPICCRLIDPKNKDFMKYNYDCTGLDIDSISISVFELFHYYATGEFAGLMEEPFGKLVSLYNQKCRPYAAILKCEEGELEISEWPPPLKQKFLFTPEHLPFNEIWHLLVYCLIEFLKGDENKGRI